jgi:hypothetical protein
VTLLPFEPEYASWVDMWDALDGDAPKPCAAVYVAPSSVIGPAISCMYHADHSDAPAGDTRHAAPAPFGLFRWTDAQAAAQLEREAAKTLHCPGCQTPCARDPRGGYCSDRCRFADNDAADNWHQVMGE